MAKDLALIVSARCRAQHGFPHRPHAAGCTGCSCSCHSVRPPADFRQRVEQAKAERAADTHDEETDGPA